ncbi:Stk1 family PASTA domain-containing Ser/Thr kinase [Paenibacillus macquariensis]|uniref:non-specific serine/threonine protein kinase n=1 Tax=Paenibacillus macquariensis TaxID=948756 RepID=A0ABY1JKZ5_9BACL|nr:Stk1 family PASTA domain-containing Ser/Thr kinase [Paenibacillus macquariensis]MEC0090049.1 Stk1 family PASTA domain-containing Ser/Thr kinase [Paenibacillus macquariensis]OAB31069.1 serine/threonine protein kinase [Paenibacillus macquariensis subsp. macquariensis]SIQ36742.1 serine/threonine protein kinase [Paenibacillus macquariensis]
MIGHELGGRYEIIERIGGGGMALVYKAHDILLGRNVAIKVLRQQFVHDEEFIRRFRREAQSAASLSHPNVVSIYDVGQEDEIHYIVMEYIEGYNLNEIIKERAPLQVEESVRIASQICDALDHAHQNQIIHRDIKPHNILIGRNGRVKVTDFGIARAVTSTTITQTGSVIGSVHYFSPEHAKGVNTGEKSDLYSLGIVLYQMLTATLPFLGESPISVALKHLQEDFDDPRDTNPLIPQSVENVILRSMRKNPQERYQSAKEMLKDLETCLLPERRNEPRIQFSEVDVDQTRAMPAIKPVSRGAVSNKRNKSSLFDEDDEGEKPVNSGQKKKWVRPTLWISLTLFILISMVGVIWYVKTIIVVQDVTIPNVVNIQEEKAVAELTALGLVIEDPIIRTYKEGFDEGVVYDQSKKEGTVVKEGSSVRLYVSKAKPLPVMPSLKDKTFDDASKLLIELGVKEANITEKPEFSDQPSGTVLGQDPEANTQIDDLDTAQIVLTVSQGEETIKMPNLVGKTQKQAESMLKEAGLLLGLVQESSDFKMEKGKVMMQWPVDANKPISVGDSVTITVSTGYPKDALNYTFNVPVAPAEEGKKSKIRIDYSDARYEDSEKKDWGTRTINTTQVLSIDLVVAPDKDAVVYLYRDGELFDTYHISYRDVKNGSVPEIVIPQTDPVLPTDVPETPPDPNQNPDNPEDVDTTALNTSGKDKANKHKQDKSNKGNNGNNGNSKGMVVTSAKP